MKQKICISPETGSMEMPDILKRGTVLFVKFSLLMMVPTAFAAETWSITTDTKSFYLNEPVSFSLKNTGAKESCLPNSAPWMIKGSKNQTIFSPMAGQAVTCVSPGKSLSWTWNQKNNNDNFVVPGDYSVSFGTKGSLAFSVSSTQGSSGFFTFRDRFRPNGSTFRVLITDPKVIRYATEIYYGSKTGHPTGRLVDDRPGKSPYDSRWSWHLEPSSIKFSDTSAEVCDGRPEDVEMDVDYWVTRVRLFCPWSATVVDLK